METKTAASHRNFYCNFRQIALDIRGSTTVFGLVDYSGPLRQTAQQLEIVCWRKVCSYHDSARSYLRYLVNSSSLQANCSKITKRINIIYIGSILMDDQQKSYTQSSIGKNQ